MQSLIGADQLSYEHVNSILQRVEPTDSLRGRTVVTMFQEPSTRTRLSFGIASQKLGADYLDLPWSESSILKGECASDTAMNLEAMGVDYLVLRHSNSNVVHDMADAVAKMSVINAGNGIEEHPTQALGDLLTLIKTFGPVSGLRVALVGDSK